jgi:predicted Zn-dependent protease
VLRARPDDASAHYWTGLARARTGATAQAVEHLGRAVELEPTLRVARLTLAAQLLVSGRPREAAQQIEAAARLAPLDAQSEHYLGAAYEAAGDRERAGSAYRRALALDPSMTESAEALSRLR